MDNGISISIVKEIIKDIYGRQGLEQKFRSLDPKIRVKMYEEWIEIVSKELKKKGFIDKVYEPINVDEMNFADIVNRTAYYLKDEQDGTSSN